MPALEAVAADLGSSGARVVALEVDVGWPEACASLVARAEEGLDPEAIIGTVAINLKGRRYDDSKNRSSFPLTRPVRAANER